MHKVSEAISLVAVLVFLAVTLPTCSGCVANGPSLAHAWAKAIERSER